MTVQELIDHLQQFDPLLEVWGEDCRGNDSPLNIDDIKINTGVRWSIDNLHLRIFF